MADSNNGKNAFSRALGIAGLVIGLIGASLGVAFAVGPAKEVGLLRDEIKAIAVELRDVANSVSRLDGTMSEHLRRTP